MALETVTMAADEAQMPFIRNLASSDRKLRTASLDSLKLFLSTRTSLTRLDALKLWKGLYYAHYMTDRPVPQQRLASDLANLADSLPGPQVVATWFAAFWEVLGERWPHVDNLRMDKFLLLVRRVFTAQLRYARPGDESGEEVIKMLSEWPFEAVGDLRKVPLGIRLHVLDLWVDELERAGFLDDAEEEEEAEEVSKKKDVRNDEKAGGAEAQLVRRMGDLVQALIHCPIKAVRDRARETYDDERLPWVEKKEEESGEENEDTNMKDDDEWGGFDD